LKKRSMTSLDVAAVVSSLSGLLEGSRLANVYGVSGVYLFRFKGRADVLLVAEPGVRLHSTGYSFTSKPMPSPFVMGLRKHIRGRRLRELGQVGFDRIAYMLFDNGCKVYVELMPRGFLVLVDEEEVILQADRQARLRDRTITRGAKYTPPPRGLDPRSGEGLERIREVAGRTSNPKKAARLLGLPYELLAEAYARGGGEPGRVAEAVLEVIEEAVGRHRGYIVLDGEGRPVWLLSFRPSSPEAFGGVEVREYQDINMAADEYFLEETRRLLLGGVEAEAEEKLRRSLEKAMERLREIEERIREAREEAYAASQYIAAIAEAWECARRVREERGWEQVPRICRGVVEARPRQGVIVVEAGGRRFQVPVMLNPYEWVNKLYKRLGELEKKRERGLKAVEELREKLDELARRIAEKRAKAVMTVRRREWYEKYHWMYTSNWLLVIGGRDASQNEAVVRKHLGEDDIFMHADIHGAPAVVVKTGGRQPPEQDLREAAVIAACYSKAWKSGAGAVDVYWAYGRQVSKHPPAGEYLTKGAFMVYGKRNYIRAVELKLAVGVADDEGAPLVIVGPQHLVEKRSIVYAVLAPGDEDPSKLAKRLHRLMKQRLGDAEERLLVEALNPEELRARIPGRSRILLVRRGKAEEPPRPRSR